MDKIPCLFERVFSPKGKVVSISATVTPGCEWVANDEGIATRKYDGTACAIIEGRLYKRLDIKNLKEPPSRGIPCARLEDSKSKPGWFPVGDGPEDRWHREAWGTTVTGGTPDGTYELCGPKLQGNPEGFAAHTLVRHGCDVLENVPRTLDGLREYLAPLDIEGIVFHHPDGRMAKIRKADFGQRRKP